MKTFVCDACHGEFPQAWTDEEALAESETLFGKMSESERAVVCDDCFIEMSKMFGWETGS